MKIHIKPEDIPSDENRAAAQDEIDSLRTSPAKS
jgi:hypothetical protein